MGLSYLNRSNILKRRQEKYLTYWQHSQWITGIYKKRGQEIMDHSNEDGDIEFWFARELMPLLGSGAKRHIKD